MVESSPVTGMVGVRFPNRPLNGNIANVVKASDWRSDNASSILAVSTFYFIFVLNHGKNKFAFYKNVFHICSQIKNEILSMQLIKNMNVIWNIGKTCAGTAVNNTERKPDPEHSYIDTL